MASNSKTEPHRDDNMGFTLVELIVALVILAILAAVVVPGLLSYIDNYRIEETKSRAQAAMAAAQAEVTACYDRAVGTQNIDTMLDLNRRGKIAENAGMSDSSGALVGMKDDPAIATPEKKGAWTVYYFAYWESDSSSDKTAVFYDGVTGEWSEPMSAAAAKQMVEANATGKTYEINTSPGE